MVKCSKCGLNNPVGNKFCSKCGSSLQTNESITQQSDTHQNTESNNNNNQQNSENNFKKICLGIIGIVILIAIIGSIFGNSQPINLEEIEAPAGWTNYSSNQTEVIFINVPSSDDLNVINITYHDNKKDVTNLPLYLESRGNKIIKEKNYLIENYNVTEIVYAGASIDYYANLYFIQFEDKWYTINYATTHMNNDFTNPNDPVNQVIHSMINQYQS